MSVNLNFRNVYDKYIPTNFDYRNCYTFTLIIPSNGVKLIMRGEADQSRFFLMGAALHRSVLERRNQPRMIDKD